VSHATIYCKQLPGKTSYSRQDIRRNGAIVLVHMYTIMDAQLYVVTSHISGLLTSFTTNELHRDSGFENWPRMSHMRYMHGEEWLPRNGFTQVHSDRANDYLAK
jgi:hypothetical protein